MNLTDNNPFRILGLPLTASAREITKQVNTLATYAELGKAKALDTDYSFLPAVNRTPEVIEEARKRIEPGENRLLHSLFWFWNNDSVDELALDVLKEGRVERAIEIWEKEVFANKATAYKAVALYDNVISESGDWFEEEDNDHRLKRNGGAYVVERKKATSYSFPTVYTYLSNDDKDWSIECDTEWLDGVDNIGYGIVFGKDKGSYLSFEIAASGYYRFDKYVDWNFTSLIPWKPSAEVDTWGTNHLQITSRDSQLSFHINGHFVDSCPREAFFGNHIGFKVTNNQTIVFSNLKICRIVEDENYGAGIRVTAKNFSHLKNLSVLFLSLTANGGTLCQDYLRKGLALANKYFSDEHIEEYSKLVAGDRYRYDAAKALQFYISNVVDSLKPYFDKRSGISTGQLIQVFCDYPVEAKRYIHSRFLAKPIKNIEREIETARAATCSSASSAVDVGMTLVEATKADIQLLKDALGKSDYQHKSIGDKLANQVVQCGIMFFNATHNDEPSLPLYQYGCRVAVSPKTKKWAKENLDSCEKWIENKVYYTCWFCGKNEPMSVYSCSITVYKETRRTWIPRSVEFSYGDIPIPRCFECYGVHNNTPDKHAAVWFGCIVGCLVLGVIIGAVVDNTSGNDGTDGAVWGGILGLLVGGLSGWLIGERRKNSQIAKAGIKDTLYSTVSQYPIISQRLTDGWQLSKPTA